jgi:nucleotide-binding universal stress UspA family protein
LIAQLRHDRRNEALGTLISGVNWIGVLEKQMTEKILCAVDNTDHTKSAIALAAKLAKAWGAELTLLAVNELIGGVGRTGPASYLWEDAELKHVLDTAAQEAERAGVENAKTIGLKSRDVARAITIYAEEIGADHIVVGSGGKGGIARLMLGSVSRDVVLRAHSPVTVAR